MYLKEKEALRTDLHIGSTIWGDSGGSEWGLLKLPSGEL